MKQHTLKIQPQYFAALLQGDKPFEVRKNDRDFNVGDVLIFTEYDPKLAKQEKKLNFDNPSGLTGRSCLQTITYILPGGQFGISPDYVVLGIRPIDRANPAAHLAAALSKLGVGPIHCDFFDDHSSSWVEIGIGKHKLTFSFNFEGTTCTDIKLYKIKQVEDIALECSIYETGDSSPEQAMTA